MNFNKLPPWALPVGAGAAIGGVVLLTKSRGGSNPVPVSQIPGQQPGGGTPGVDMIVQAALNTMGDQQAAFAENMLGLQAGNAANIADLIGAQNQAISSNNSTLLNLFTQWQTALSEQLEDITSGAVTGPQTLVDSFKKRFATAFQRMGKPFGTAVPNSDIIIGDFGAAGAYKQDTGFTYYDSTGHAVTGPFRQFLGNMGGAKSWGRPVSQVFKDQDGYDTQVFENAIFKYIPGSNPKNYDIQAFHIV